MQLLSCLWNRRKQIRSGPSQKGLLASMEAQTEGIEQDWEVEIGGHRLAWEGSLTSIRSHMLQSGRNRGRI